jgi:hypothetical protein
MVLVLCMLDKQGYTLIVYNAFWFCMATVVECIQVLCLYIRACPVIPWVNG